MRTKEYRSMGREKLEKELKNLKRELVISYGKMGMAKVKKKEGGTSRGGSDLSKRIKKEIAKVKTILRETKNDGLNSPND